MIELKEKNGLKERNNGDCDEIPHFDFILGDFNMLIKLDREQIQPILYDDQNFQEQKQILFDNEQLINSMKTVSELQEFQEHVIGIYLNLIIKILCQLLNLKKEQKIIFFQDQKNFLHILIE